MMAAERSSRRVIRRPWWLERVMGPERGFFEGCKDHSDHRKNEKNIFCLRCCLSLCPHCLPSHPSHPLLQVRRYVYHDVIRLGDLEKLIDCSCIQPYTINGAKVIFLNERPQSRSCKGNTANFCFNCDRILQEPFHFCSLRCKVDHLLYQGEDLSDILRRYEESDFSMSQFEGLRMDGSDRFGDEAEAEAEAEAHQMISNTRATYSMNNNLDDGVDQGSSSRNIVSMGMAAPQRNKKKDNSNGSGNGFFSAAGGSGSGSGSALTSIGSRRKGAPQRAPFS